MDLRHTLSNLSKDPKQSMEDYLRHINYVANMLASIRWLPHFPMVLISSPLMIFALKIHYEQRLKILNTKDILSIQHSALAISVTSYESGKPPYTPCHNESGGQRNNHRNNNRKEHKNQEGTNHQQQHHYANRSLPTGTSHGNTVFSWSSIQCSSPSATNLVFAGNTSSSGVLGSHPDTVCQICFSPGHTAVGCPQSYTPS